jgi:cytoskeletal protein CcmA (bactofilin family)
VSQSRVGIGKETALNANLDISGSATVTGSLSVNGLTTITGTLSGSFTANNPSSSLILINGNTQPSASLGGASAMYVNTTLSASANNQVLVGLDINPTFANGAFTGVSNFVARIGSVTIGKNGQTDWLNFNNQVNLSRNNEIVFSGLSTGTTISSRSSSTPVIFALNQTITEIARFAATSGNLLLNTTSDAGYRLDVSGSTRLNGNTTVTGSIDVSGSITSNGTITAQKLVVQTITSSVEFITGSTQNGSLLANTHQFTGSVLITGSLAVNGSSAILTNQTSSMSVSTASFALTASYISGSGGGVGFPFSGSAIITGSFLVSSSFVDFTQATYVTGSFTGSLQGTASYASYAVYAGNSPGSTSTMTQSVAATTWSFTHNLNTRNPLLQVYDSTNSQIIPFAVIGSDPNQATIYFDVAESGYAVASNGGLLTVNGSTARLDQTTSAVTWSFQHNLATKYPNFIIYDSTDNVVIPAGIHAVNDMTAEIYFAFPSTGVAIANFSGISGSVNTASASYAVTATTASYSTNFTVANQLTIDQTLTDYHTVPSSIVGSNNIFTKATGSYSSAFFKYSVTKGSNSRAGEVIAAWAGGTLQFTDNSTLDVGDTSGVVATAIIAASSVQFNITTADSAWTLKTLATFM